MRILVLGNSDSDGRGLAGALPWPDVMGEEFQHLSGAGAEVVTVPFVARPGATAYVEHKLDEHAPGAVVLPLSAHLLIYHTITARMRRSLPAALYPLYERVANGFKARAQRLGAPGRLIDRQVRRLARRVVGTAPVFDGAGVIAWYEEVICLLGRREDVTAVVSSGTRYSRRLQRENPAMVPAIERFRATLRAAVERYRMPRLDLDEALGEGDEREACYAEDGIHKTGLGHLRIGRAFAQVFAARVPV